jgi:hypothetical protein
VVGITAAVELGSLSAALLLPALRDAALMCGSPMIAGWLISP